MSEKITKSFLILVMSVIGSNTYAMQVCQMTDTLIWDIEVGFDLDSTEVEEYSAPYDVLVANGFIYLPDGNDFIPLIFNDKGFAERMKEYGGYLWFRVSETDYRIMDLEFGTIWNSKLTCAD